MQKKPILLALFAILSFLAWRHFTATPQTTPPTPLTPEQQVNALLSRSVIPAKELAEFCEKYPSLVTSALKKDRKPLAVSGRISKALTLGVNSDNLAIELDGQQNLKLMFQSDYKKLLKWMQNQPQWSQCRSYKFHRESQTIILDGYLTSSLPGSIKNVRSSFSHIVCREGDTITLRGEFRHIGSGWVKFDLLEMP